ncbi:AraC family transcriptional regulator [Aquimarina sp. RZ0]|uniref:helix-turn-helix domain-containing protein n=1 Tax=Aquimarina sp. RZ0 TaxID=2607730 RepID=UPI0011F2C1CF|nr:helix-turn-helix transcriptional regulator [Aquimarina sp. RZ0]KAA1244377.1 helix-turn-helix domain-containing protein [Aquimarina sp. RZ0]
MKAIPILNITQFERQESLEDFYSNDLKTHLEKNKNIFHKAHKHDFFLCVLFAKGSGIHEVDFNTYDVTTGSIFFLMPGQTHYWKFDDEPEGYIFFHSQNFYEFYFSNKKLQQFPFYYSYNNPPYLILTSHQIVSLELYFKEINVEFHQKLIYNKQKIASLIDLIYIDLSRLYVRVETSYKNSSPTYLRTLAALENTIEQFYKLEKSAKFYAEKLNITPKHLNRITKTTLNKTTTDLITERILLEAKRLIVHSENPLSRIGENLGYEDYAYFSRVFKLKTNKTPLEFRQEYR